MSRFAWVPFLLCLWAAVACAAGRDGTLTVHSAWARPTPQGAPASAFYMTIENGSSQADTLQDVRSDSCDAVEIHRTQVDEEGVMRMSPVENGQLVIPAGESVVLEPGGLHVMCIGSRTLEEGEQVLLQLAFERAGSLAVTADVRQDVP